jgi:hypothetical protein
MILANGAPEQAGRYAAPLRNVLPLSARDAVPPC